MDSNVKSAMDKPKNSSVIKLLLMFLLIIGVMTAVNLTIVQGVKAGNATVEMIKDFRGKLNGPNHD